MIGVLLASGLLQGCQSRRKDFKQVRLENADRHFTEISKRLLPAQKVFTLTECIQSALKSNLDIKAQELREAIRKEMVNAAVLGMLPKLNLEYSGTERFNEPGSSSQSLITGRQSLEPSRSTEKRANQAKIELILGVLDFGLAYHNSVQADDKMLLVSQQKRRAAQNLVVDVTGAYFRVAAAQYAMNTTQNMISMSEDTEEFLQDGKNSGLLSPLEALKEKGVFLQLKQRLREYKRSYENSCVELTTLMGYYPSSYINVDVRFLNSLQEVYTPEIDLLERLALEERPELTELDIQSDIMVIEAKKAILMMFPNVRFFASFTTSSNKFLYKQSWTEIGARATYDLLSLPIKAAERRSLKMGIDELDMRTRALSIGIMAQVRISHANLFEVKERYKLAEEILTVHKEHLEEAKKTAETTGKLSPIEIRRYELETAAASIDRTLELGNYYLAYYRLLNSLGVKSIDEKRINILRARKVEAEMTYKSDGKVHPATGRTDSATLVEILHKTQQQLEIMQQQLEIMQQQMKMPKQMRIPEQTEKLQKRIQDTQLRPSTDE